MNRPSKEHHRRSNRLRGYDYSIAGAYFVTICIQNRKCLLGNIVKGEMRLNDFGKIVSDQWVKTADINNNIELDEWVVMPNHFHGIVIFTHTVGAIHESPLQMTIKQRRNMALPKLIGRFKMLTAKNINQLCRTPGSPIWQRNYYEHIVRDEIGLNRIRQYINENPARWDEDTENPAKIASGVNTMNLLTGTPHPALIQGGKESR
jgi:putative transposase